MYVSIRFHAPFGRVIRGLSLSNRSKVIFQQPSCFEANSGKSLTRVESSRKFFFPTRTTNVYRVPSIVPRFNHAPALSHSSVLFRAPQVFAIARGQRYCSSPLFSFSPPFFSFHTHTHSFLFSSYSFHEYYFFSFFLSFFLFPLVFFKREGLSFIHEKMLNVSQFSNAIDHCIFVFFYREGWLFDLIRRVFCISVRIVWYTLTHVLFSQVWKGDVINLIDGYLSFFRNFDLSPFFISLSL